MGKGVSILPTFVENLDIPLFFFKDFIYRQRGREGEKHQHVVASRVPPTGDLVHNPGMCPDWDLNQRPCGSQVGTQSTEPHQPGQILYF